MTRIMVALLVGIGVASSGCATREDTLATSKAGYVENAATIVASTDWSQPEVIGVNLSEYEFSPAELAFRQSVPYRLVLRNTGATTHYFVSKGFFRAIAARTLVTASGEIENPLLQSIAVPSGAEKEILLVPVKTGVYELKCTAPFHSLFGMTGTIKVR